MITEAQIQAASMAMLATMDACIRRLGMDPVDAIRDVAMKYALEAAERAQWQLIETAPRDTRILVYDPGNINIDPMIGVASYHKEAGFIINEFSSPTHWRPLPEPPDASK